MCYAYRCEHVEAHRNIRNDRFAAKTMRFVSTLPAIQKKKCTQMNGANELAQWLTAQITVQMSSNVLWMDGDGICGILTTATVFLTITSRLDRTFSQPVVAWL